MIILIKNRRLIIHFVFIYVTLIHFNSAVYSQDASVDTLDKSEKAATLETAGQDAPREPEGNQALSEASETPTVSSEKTLTDIENIPSVDSSQVTAPRNAERSDGRPDAASSRSTLPSEDQAPSQQASGDVQPNTAPQEPSPPLPLIPTGSFFSRYELREGQRKITVPSPRVGEMDAIAYRARFGLATTPVEVADCLKAQIQFTPQASGFWQAGGLNDAELGLHEGFVRLLSCHVRFDIGRMELAYGDHLVIGNVGWHQTGRSFDGMRLRIGTDPKSMWVDLLATAMAEG